MKMDALSRLLPFLEWLPGVGRSTVKNDALAGITGAVIVLPQAIAFANIAGLPAEYGLYSAIVPVIVAALFGSSHHLISGPTTAISLVIFSKISQLATPFSAEYIGLALTLTMIVGIIQIGLGLARLGVLANFVSHSVVLGFTAGAAILIGTSQLGPFFGVSLPKGLSFYGTWKELLANISQASPATLYVSLTTLFTAWLFKRFLPKWPGLLAAMLAGSLVALFLDGESHGLRFVGALRASLPPPSLPDLSLETMGRLVPGALAVAMLGLAEAVSIARSIATHSHQRIDNGREFLGQGLSNFVGSFFSSYASSGSFTRTGVNYNAGAKTPLAAVCSALAVASILMLVAPLTAYLPIASMAGILMFVAIQLIEWRRIRAIYTTSWPETGVLAATFLSTLLVELEFAIFSGVILSLLLYLKRTSHPHFIAMAPNPEAATSCFIDTRPKPTAECPQLKMLRLDGSIFYGAVNHISEELHQIAGHRPELRHIVIVGSGINFVDVSGCEMLLEEGRSFQLEGKVLYLCSLKEEVKAILAKSRCAENLGRIFSSKKEALENILPMLDPKVCIECGANVFWQCEALKQGWCPWPPAPQSHP
ncbi:MAG: SulP family inorganic anion transporter [Syntrophobacteraceae bacterium]